MTAIVPLTLLEIDDDGYHIAIEGRLNDQFIRLIVDTGASKTVFDEGSLSLLMNSSEFKKHEQFSTAVGSSELPSMIARIEKMEFGDLKVLNFEVAVMNLEHVHSSYQLLNLPEVHGVLGSDFLKKHEALIDFKNNILQLEG